ncbi:MAG: hypothetical protein ACXVXC_10765 [Nocardioidaceae bacterium]
MKTLQLRDRFRRRRIHRLADRVKRAERAVRSAAKENELRAREINRIAPQLAALEGKVEDLRQRLEPAPRCADEAELAESRGLVEEVRREHRQVRVRLSAVTTFEERVRRIEEKLGLPHD